MEALAIISFAGAGVSFVTQTIPRCRHIATVYRRHRELVIQDKELLESCSDSLKLWSRIWDHNFGQEPEVYEELWGQEGFWRVQGNLTSLKKQYEHCFDLMRAECGLREPKSFRRADERSICEWLGLSKAARDYRDFSLRDESILIKLSYSLYRCDELRTELARARDLMANLMTSTEGFFRGRGYSLNQATVTDTHVGLCKNMIRMSRFASALYDVFWKKHSSFEFVLDLRWPENDQKPHYFDLVRDNPQVEFSINYRFWDKNGDIKHGRKHFVIMRDAHSRGTGQKIKNIRARDFIWLTGALDIYFEGNTYRVSSVGGRPDRQHRCIRASLRGRPLSETSNMVVTNEMIDCTMVLVAVTLWFILFLKTKWFAHLHGSRVHCAPLNGNEPDQLHKGAARRRAYVFKPWTVRDIKNIPEDDSKSNLPNDKLILLGALYGELALGKEVRLETKGGQTLFAVNGHPPMRDKFFIYTVQCDAGLIMGHAVEFCLNSRDRRTVLPDHSIRLDEIEENVLVPVRTYRNMIIYPAPNLGSAYG